MSRHTNPAIYAGLAGAAAFAVPTYAHAVEVFGTNIPLSEVGLAFVGGCVSGAIVASGVSVAVEHVLTAREERAQAAHMFDMHASHAAAAAPVAAAPAASAPAASAPAGKRFKQAGSEPQFYGRHSAEARAVREWEQTGAIRVQNAGAKHQAEAPAGASHMATDANPASMTGAWDAYVANTSNDYADVADAYVQKLTLAERMSARAKGVANVLSERINANKMEGLPVIARADGTVADMGESWWDEVFAEDQVIGAGQTSQSAQPAQPQYAQPAPVAAATPAQSQYAQPAVAAPSTSSSAEKYSDEQQDLWAQALSALDDRFTEAIAMGPEAQNPIDYSFMDEIGNADTLDEPDGLEPDTMFMSFKPTAGHPEVQDTTSYVDLLIDQEFAQNESAAARKSVRGVMRNYLRVVDGTGAIDAVRKAPKHMAAAMAPLAFAQQA